MIQKTKTNFFYLSISLFSKGLKLFLISSISDSFRWSRDSNFDINIWYTSFPRRRLKMVSRHPTASANALQSSRSLESFSFSVSLGISVCRCFLTISKSSVIGSSVILLNLESSIVRNAAVLIFPDHSRLKTYKIKKKIQIRKENT